MLEKNKTRKILSLIICVLMILGSSIPSVLNENNLVYASQNSQVSFESEMDLNKLAEMKIETAVKEDFEKEDLIEVMVYMNAQMDTEMVAQNAKASLSALITPYQEKLQVRRNVVGALKDNAEVTQTNVVKYLEQEMKKGNVEEFKSYTIVNMLYVKATKEVLESLSFMPEVGKIYKNKTHSLDVVGFEDENYTNNIKANFENVEWNVSRIRADEVWDLGFDGTGVVVGILDTGVQWDHPALKNKWRGYDPVSGTTNPVGNWFDAVHNSELPADAGQHGTHVMGTVLGQEEDGSNKIGVAPGAKWIAARVFDEAGATTDRKLLDAADWMLSPGGNPDMAPDIVNNSWGGGAVMDDYYREAVRAYRAANIVPIFSAGNRRPGESAPWPGSITCPANYPESIAVAATDIDNMRGSFSKLGPSPYDENMIKPDLSAPGVSIRSAVPGNGYEDDWDGTSMAAPAVSGAIALMLSANASLTVDEIEKILKETARPLTDSNYKKSPNMAYGYGLVDAFEAVSIVAPGTGRISGKVLVPGEDILELVINHEQNIFDAYLGTDTDIYANIADDVAVIEANLLVKAEGETEWKLIPMERTSGDHRNGIYKGTISGSLLEGNSLTYKIVAKDYADNIVSTLDYEVDIKFGIIPGEYAQGFEDGVAGGWSFLGSKAWEIGEPTNVGPKAYEGNNVVATRVNKNYPNNADSWLVLPPIDLRDSSLETASLRFYDWYAMELLYDFGYILISDDNGETWSNALPRITGQKEEWSETIINLNSYIGSATPIYIAFRFTSNNSTERAGWYIDGVRLVAKDNEAPDTIDGLKARLGLEEVYLSWNKSKDQDLSHYNLYRREVSEGQFVKLVETNDNKFLDTNLSIGTTYVYAVAAEDFSGNESIYAEVTVTVEELPSLYSSDFEDDNGGLVSGLVSGTENPWQWGIPTTGPMEAKSGVNLWATNLSGPYENNTDAYIEIPELEIPSDKEAILTFKHWFDFEYDDETEIMVDYAQVLISTDDVNWFNITPIPGRYGTRLRDWQDEKIILSGYSGETVKIRFQFHSNGSTTYDGWYIDDITVSMMDYEAPEEHNYDEIAYDDGTAEEAYAYVYPGGGYAVLFRPERSCKVMGTSVYLWGEDFPEPGGNRLGFLIYDKNRNQIGAPIYVDDLKRGYWNYIDLSSYNYTTDEDFYISSMQDLSLNQVPAIGFDENPASNGSRTFVNMGSDFYGGYGSAAMIRALVVYDEVPEEGDSIDNGIIAMQIPTFNISLSENDEEYQTLSDEEVQDIPLSSGYIPAQYATVTIKETGVSAKVDPVTGEYFIRVKNGTYTVIAEAYGHNSSEKTVIVDSEEISEVDFILGIKSKGSITGRLFDRYYKTPIANAVIRIIEDPRINPVMSDENGNFIINDVYEGEYTLKSRSEDFVPGEANVVVEGYEISQVEIEMQRFVGYENEIAYDDKTGESTMTGKGVGDGLAVKFTPAEYGKVKGANIYFWDVTFPIPGGDRIGIAIYEVGEDGEAYRVGEPKFVNIKRGAWNYIDLSEFKFATEGDFFISTVQDDSGTYSPAIGLDKGLGEQNYDRSFQNLGGVFRLLKDNGIDGGLMIRAVMEYALDTPVITNLSSGINYTNQDVITVSGAVAEDAQINVYVNGAEPVAVNSNNKEFSAQVNLVDEVNNIKVTAVIDGKETEASETVVVVKDQISPVIEVISPEDNAKLNSELVNVIGNATDDIKLAKLEVNGKEVAIGQNGRFSEKVLLDQGVNIIEIKATDIAGNVTIVTRTVTTEYETPVIENITPDTDVILREGDTLTVSFKAAAGGKGYFKLILPIGVQSDQREELGIAMTENNGVYTGIWTAEEGMAALSLRVEVMYINAFGNKTTAIANGKVNIVDGDVLPIDIMENLPSNAVIVGDEAYDIDYLNSNSRAQEKLISWMNSGQVVYVKLNKTTIVNSDGVMARIDDLEDIITYYDALGNVTCYEK